ncbi:MAG: serine hydrolase, partial [Bacteroidota bacterium]
MKPIQTIFLLTLVVLYHACNTQKPPIEEGRAAPVAQPGEDTLAFGDIPYLAQAYIDAAPANRNDGITVGELGSGGGDKAMILALAQELADSLHGCFDSFLIVHQGKLVFESYYRKGRVNLPHPQASATKSYTSLALGRAIQLGYLTMGDLDKPLVSFLDGLDSSTWVAGAETITLHKALTMRSGIRHSPEDREAFEQEPGKLLGQGQVQTYLENSAPITEASQQFKYQND